MNDPEVSNTPPPRENVLLMGTKPDPFSPLPARSGPGGGQGVGSAAEAGLPGPASQCVE